MRILVIQLARLGDIYQTWPVLRALRRKYPQGEIHLLTREKFKAAYLGLEEVNSYWALNTADILRPLVSVRTDIAESLEHLDAWYRRLADQDFDLIINLSFSPFSSYLTWALTGETTVVRGYSRHADGYLDIPDDASAYFYAQVGPDRDNRLHVTEIFAQVADVELIESDWAAPRFAGLQRNKQVVIHVGASEAKKTYGAHKWLQVVKGLLREYSGDVILIGAKGEEPIAEVIANVSGPRMPINLVGKTSLPELFKIISEAELLIGCDSAPVHIAALTRTPVLNLSFRSVCFWETGPKSAGSRILLAEDADDLASDVVVSESLSMLRKTDAEFGRAIEVLGPLHSYEEGAPAPVSGAWELIKALYFGLPFPPAASPLFQQGILRIHEANELALEQIAELRKNHQNITAAGILDRVSEMFEVIARMTPELGTLIRWYQTEEIRLGPMPLDRLFDMTEILRLRLRDVLRIYILEESQIDREDKDGHVGMG